MAVLAPVHGRYDRVDVDTVIEIHLTSCQTRTGSLAWHSGARWPPLPQLAHNDHYYLVVEVEHKLCASWPELLDGSEHGLAAELVEAVLGIHQEHCL